MPKRELVDTVTDKRNVLRDEQGRFEERVDTPEREACNPATGVTIQVAAAKKLTFSPAKGLKVHSTSK